MGVLRMTQILERAIRRYVADGSGLDLNKCIPGNSKGSRPKEPYSSLLYINRERRGYPAFRQLTGGMTLKLQYYQAMYSLQFYRNGAVDNAERFQSWAETENGLNVAESAFPDGKVAHIIVSNEGAGYTSAPSVSLSGAGGSDATATAVIAGGKVIRVDITSAGTEYSSSPDVSFIGGGGSDAAAIARGRGFIVVFPFDTRRLDEVVGDSYEERVQINLAIDYADIITQNTGMIDDIRVKTDTENMSEDIKHGS